MAGKYTLDSSGADKRVADVAKRDAYVRRIGHIMEGNIKESMINSPASGNVYERGDKIHTASAPGNPPRVDFGTLIGSIRVAKIRDMVHQIGTHILHGRKTEFGIGIAARPWLRPEFERAKSWIKNMKKDDVV